MNNQASRVAVVNQIARQLMHSGHPSEKEIRAQQDKLNTRYTWLQQWVGEGGALAQLCFQELPLQVTGLSTDVMTVAAASPCFLSHVFQEWAFRVM